MQEEIERAGGRIDAIYYCSDLADDSPRRKPNPAMGHEAVKAFPDIDLSKALMVGNRMSDMSFGRNLGVYTVYLATTHPDTDPADPLIDAVFPTLPAFAKALTAFR